jgi:transcription antitermination factor NusG
MLTDWKVLYTHPRAEKQVEIECRALGLDCYLPLRTAVRIYQRRKVTFTKPLFPGYVFVELLPQRKGELFSFGHIARVIPVSRPVKMLRQLVMVRKALALDPGLDATDPVSEGEIVRIGTGPMQGCEGVVSRIRRKAGSVILLLSVDIIGRAVPIELDRSLIERIYDSRTRTYKRVENAAAQAIPDGKRRSAK